MRSARRDRCCGSAAVGRHWCCATGPANPARRRARIPGRLLPIRSRERPRNRVLHGPILAPGRQSRVQRHRSITSVSGCSTRDLLRRRMPEVLSGSTNFATRGTAGTTGSARSPSLTMGLEGSRCCPAIGIECHSRSIPFPPSDGGLRARLVDLAGASAADYQGKDIAGAVVLTDAPLGRVWPEAVKKRGAAGVISTAIARYVRPSGTAHLTEEQKDVLQWDSIPFDPSLCGASGSSARGEPPLGCANACRLAPSSCA